MTPLSISHLPPGAPWWIFAIVVTALVLHIGGGSIGIISGYTAVFVRKGGNLHRIFGTAFFVSMVAMGTMGLSLSVWIRQFGNIAGGVLATYLVATAWMTVKRKAGTIGRFEIIAFLAALAAAGLLLYWGLLATLSAKGTYQGYGAALYYVFGVFAALSAALDFKVIRQGGISGAARIARHLWRMCFALFFAAASFFLGQQKVMPAFMHGSPLLFIPSFAPLILMIFWLARVRFAKWFARGASKARRANGSRALGQPA
ncbi:MAG TPA: hypothetical protein VGI20_08795 [Rhizomicrobium sp.]|jgi:hypothetical protein